MSFLHHVVFWEMVACVLAGGARVSGAMNVAGEEQLWRLTVLRGTVVLKWTCGKLRVEMSPKWLEAYGL